MRFVLDVLKFSQSFSLSHEHSNSRCSWDVFIGIPYTYVYALIEYVQLVYRDNYINTSAWVLRCSFNLDGQCEKPQDVERATSQTSTLFYIQK